MPTNNIHPAQYSKELINPLAGLLIQYKPPGDDQKLIDPCCGLGWRLAEIANLAGMHPIGVEIEEAYLAYAHPCVQLGDSTCLNFPRESFDAAVTSPVYPNGMADNFKAKDNSKRHTYIHRIREQFPDYELKTNNPASLSPRGSESRYQDFLFLNDQIYWNVFRVLKPGAPFVVNTKSTGKYQFTVDTVDSLIGAGFEIVDQLAFRVSGLNHGSHQQNKVKQEDITVCRRP